jgi:hypothetical protein
MNLNVSTNWKRVLPIFLENVIYSLWYYCDGTFYITQMWHNEMRIISAKVMETSKCDMWIFTIKFHFM